MWFAFFEQLSSKTHEKGDLMSIAVFKLYYIFGKNERESTASSAFVLPTRSNVSSLTVVPRGPNLMGRTILKLNVKENHEIFGKSLEHCTPL